MLYRELKWLLLSSALLSYKLSAGQGPETYPKDYFRNPLDIPILLAGNFGECRPNHFHTGLDLKTNGKENQRVYAAAEGYIARVSISHSGYGNALYIKHPNGYTTVYGHLNDFFPELQTYVIAQQYAQRSWAIDLNLDPGQFPVGKGQFVAFSGNTGGSTGPHLHFEIRNSETEHVLNAALFGLPVKDERPPVPHSIALYGAQSVYVQRPVLVKLQQRGDGYQPAEPRLSTAEPFVRFGLLADDFMEGSANTLGVYEMELYMDDILQAAWRLNDIDFEQNRYVNAFADYRLKEEQKGWYQTLFRVPGNNLDAYTMLNEKNGLLDISDGKEHAIRIVLRDAQQNASTVRFAVVSTAKVTSSPCTLTWNAGKENSLLTPTLSFKLDKTALYDDVCFDYTETPSQYYSAMVRLGDSKIPLQSYSELSVKLNKLLPFDLRSKLIFVHQIKAAHLPGNNPQDAMAARFDKGWAVARVRTLGNYYVTVDTTGPAIQPLQKPQDIAAAGKIRITVKDDKTSVKSFEALLNGQWLRFVRAGNTYTYTLDQYCVSGDNELVISAADENDNVTTHRIRFKK